MQLGAITAQNFTGNRSYIQDDIDDFITDDFREIYEEPENDSFERKFSENDTIAISNFINDVNKTKSDISPITCVVGTLAAYATLKNGSKAVGYARSAIAHGAELISKGCVNLASKVKKSINVNEAGEKIHKFFQKFTNENGVTGENEKIVKNFSTLIDTIFGPKELESGEVQKRSTAVIESLKKNGIYMNAKSIFDNTLAAIGAIFVADGISDATESAIDKNKIEESALKNFSMYKKVADTIVNDVIG